MQPLPFHATTSLFVDAAAHLRAAAAATAEPSAPALLESAAREITQALPSLRWSTGPAGGELATALNQAVTSMRSLARTTDHTLWLGTQDPVENHFGYSKELAIVRRSRADVLDWASLSDAAAALVAERG